MTNTDKRIGLIGLYDATGITVKLHKPGCNALNRANSRKGHHLCGALDASDLADLDEREFKTVICKCAK